MKKSVLREFTFKNKYTKEGMPELIVYQCTFDNFDSGSSFLLPHEANQIRIGYEYSYEITGKGNIKFKGLEEVSSNVHPQQPAYTPPTPPQNQYQPPQNQYKVQKSNYQAKETDYLGFSASYAKDLVIAGKITKKDIEAFKSILTEIYSHIKEIQKAPTQNQDPQPE